MIDKIFNAGLGTLLVLIFVFCLFVWTSLIVQEHDAQQFQQCVEQTEQTDKDICDCAKKVGRHEWAY